MTKPAPIIDIISTEDLKDNLTLDEIWCVKTDGETGEIIDIIRVTPEWIGKHLK